jgi:hypothetical protein
MKKRLLFVANILSVSLILLFAAVAVNYSSNTVPNGKCVIQADGIPLPPPPPPNGGGGKFLGDPATPGEDLGTLLAFGGDGIPLPPPPPPNGGGGKFLDS